jgi:hypothetical protein
VDVRQLILALLVLACAAGAAAAAKAGQEPKPAPAPVATTAEIATAAPAEPEDPTPRLVYLRQIRSLERQTWHWQQVMGVARRPAPRIAAVYDKVVLRKVRARWRRFTRAARLHAQHVPHRGAWLCIHRYEGSWSDDGPPYYGGLQMDWGFMAAYGRYLLRTKGPANHWTPLEQMWVAEHAYRSGRGFYPWPNTARYCGLI